VSTQRNICGPVVARLRKKNGVSQAELSLRCRRAGWPVARSVLAKIETRRRAVSDYELVALAAALGIKVAKLLTVRRKAAEK
jgi:transcriptional regulator with XRE-family HTH domain